MLNLCIVKADHFNVSFRSLFDHMILLFVSIVMQFSICVCEHNMRVSRCYYFVDKIVQLFWPA